MSTFLLYLLHQQYTASFQDPAHTEYILKLCTDYHSLFMHFQAIVNKHLNCRFSCPDKLLILFIPTALIAKFSVCWVWSKSFWLKRQSKNVPPSELFWDCSNYWLTGSYHTNIYFHLDLYSKSSSREEHEG